MDALKGTLKRGFASQAPVLGQAAVIGGLGAVVFKFIGDQMTQTAEGVNPRLLKYSALVANDPEVVCALDDLLSIVEMFAPELCETLVSIVANMDDLAACVDAASAGAVGGDLPYLAHLLSTRVARDISDVCAAFPVLAPSRDKLERLLQEVFESRESMNSQVRALERARPRCSTYLK